MTSQATSTRRRRLDPTIIRVGDRVRILRAVPVDRVGYPKTVADYYEEVERQSGADLKSLFEKYGFNPRNARHTGMRQLFVHNLAYLVAKADGFGGGERQIFFGAEIQRHIGAMGMVQGIRIVKTGTYYGPTHYHCWHSGEYDYEPGGLIDEKTHKICTVKVGTDLGVSLSWHYGPHDFLAADLEKVPP